MTKAPKAQYWYWNHSKEELEYFDSLLDFTEHDKNVFKFVGCFSDRVWALNQIARIIKNGGYNKTLTVTLNDYFTKVYPELLL